MKIRVLMLLVIACSSGQHPAASGASAVSGSASKTAAGSGASSTPQPEGCPPTFASASGHCSMTVSCSYAEGDCYCGEAPWCGGAAPPPPNPATFAWQCTPKVRADGCPGTAPSGACTREGQTCDYTCSCSETARCTGGAWKLEHGPCKP